MNSQLEIDNHTLVEECRNGDKEALNLFYLRFAPRMLSVIRRYVNDQKDAEDILHDGFIVAFTRLSSLRDAGKVDYWLATIMKNLSLHFLQAQDVTQILHDIPDVEDTPQIEDIIDLETLETLITRLPAGYQKVFRLAVLENKSHKEIAKLLGIAPNSSSSQLFHAKLMMRKLITEYKKQTGVWSILLLGIIGGIVIWRNIPSNNTSVELLTAERKSTSLTQAAPIVIAEGIKKSETGDTDKESSDPNKVSKGLGHTLPGKVTKVSSNTDPGKESKSSGNTDSEKLVKASETSVSTTDDCENNREEVIGSGKVEVGVTESPLYAYGDNVQSMPESNEVKGSSSLWSLRLSADPGFLSLGNGSKDDLMCSTNPANPPSVDFTGPVDNPNKPTTPDTDGIKDKGDKSSIPSARSRSSVYSNYASVPHTNSLPMSFSASVSKTLNKTFSVESGLTYTYLHSTFETFSSKSDCYWHYLGIPVKINIRSFSYQRVKLYASVGGSIDIPLYSKAVVSDSPYASYLESGRFNSPVVWSMFVGYGIGIKLSNRVDIFLEPTLQYHFKHDYTVPNVWSDNQWGFSLPIGFRFNL